MFEQQEEEIEITAEQIKSWHPLIALPCYDQQLTEPFFMSILKTCMGFKDIGLNFSISTLSDSLISRSRNQLVAKFMANPAYTHIMFIDVDLAFMPDDILKMLWHDREIVTAAYPIKDINWNKVAEHSANGIEPDKLAEKATRFVVNPVQAGNNTVRVDNGLISVYDAGTGFMLIKRSAIEKLVAAYPELKYKDDTGLLKDEERNWSYAFFNSYVDDSGRFLSEDYGFCRYWQKIGGDIWTDPSIELSHVGRMTYKGKLIEYLMEIAEPAE